MALEDDQMCYGCGSKNAQGLKLRFEHPEKGLLRSTVIFSKEHQGFKDIVHGGMVGLVLDEMMVNLAWKEGLPAVTAQMSFRLKKPVRVGETVYLEGRIDRQESRILYASATAKNAGGQLMATATAACMRIK